MIDKHNFSEYQIKSINKRKALKFDIELKANKKIKKKLTTSIINNLDVLIEDLLDQGVKFYKINFYEKYHNFDTVCVDMEDTVNFCKSEVSMIELIYLVLTKNLDKTYSTQCIIATRTLSNDNILSSLKDLFNPLNEDILISQLCGHQNILSNWKNLIKEQNYKFHRFVYFSEFHHRYYGSLAELVVTFYPECGYDLDFIEGALDCDIKGISGSQNSNEKICLNLLNLYFKSKGLYMYCNNLYKIIENSKYSYEFWDNIYSVDSGILKILDILKGEYVMQLKKLDVYDLIISCWENVFCKFLLNKPNYFNHILFDNNIIEFNDGLYFLSTNYFCSFDDFNFSKIKNLGCYKYFDLDYEICKNLKPMKFIESFQLEFLEFDKFFLNLGFWVNSRVLRSKNEINVISDFNLKKNIFTVNICLFDLKDKSRLHDLFCIRQLEDKKLLVCTSYLYNGKLEPQIKLNEIGVLNFQFNENLDEKMLNDKVLLIKLIVYTMSFIHCNKVNDVCLEQELAKIIIYCNNIFSEEKNFIINNVN